MLTLPPFVRKHRLTTVGRLVPLWLGIGAALLLCTIGAVTWHAKAIVLDVLIVFGAASAIAAAYFLARALLGRVHDYERLAAALEESRRSLENAQRVARIGSWTARVQEPVVIDWSPEAFRVFGVDLKTWDRATENLLDLVHPEDKPLLDEARRRAIDTSSSYSLTYRVIRPDGTLCWVQTQAEIVRDAVGRAAQIVGTVQDVTERKLAEDALRLSEARLRDYAETASDWYWETGLDHRFTYMSGRIRAHGLDHAEWVGKTRFDCAADRDKEPEKWRSHIAMLDRHEPFRNFVYRVNAGGERQMYISVSGKPVFDAHGRFNGHRGTGRDVTAAIQSEEKLREAKASAEAASAAKTAFLANMSHELRTPLNAIIGFAEAMAGGYFGTLNDKQREYLRDIKTSGNHLLLLINDLLDVSKIEAGKFELHREMVGIAEEISACLRLVEPRAEEGRVDIHTDIPDDLPPYYADRRALKQVLLNLLANAVKFTPPGGRVAIEARSDITGDLTISVSDTGIGIASQDLPKIVLPFGSLARNANLSRTHEGTGLGLPLSKSLVELHGGRLEIVSELGHGTIATIRFPPAVAAA